MFSFATKHRYISKTIVMMVLMLTFVAPLSAPLMVLAQDTATPKTADQFAAPALQFGCGVTNLGACIPAAAWGVMVAVGQVMTMASLALNYSVQQLVVKMGSFVNSPQMESINITWRTMRDLVNVFLVFLTIFIGIATIIGISGYGYKQLLWKVVLAALFVNFSITFTKFVIDISNIVTIATYGQLLQVNANLPSPGSFPADCTDTTVAIIPPHCMNKGLAAVFLHQTKITTIYSSGTVTADGLQVNGTKRLGVILWIAIFGSIFFLILAFIFGAAAFFIAMRFAILILLIMFSPIGLVAWITGISGIGRKWWHALLNQSFFLPIMFIMWWASVQVMAGMNAALMGNNPNLAEALGAPANESITSNPAGFTGLAGVFLYFFIVSILMIASLVIARNLGAYGASAAMNTGKSWSRKAGGLAFAGTVGVASSRAATLYQRRMANAQVQDENGAYVDNSRRARFTRSIAGTKIDRYAQAGLGAGANAGVLGTKSLNQRREINRTEASQRREELRGGAVRGSATQHVTTLGQTAPVRTPGMTDAQFEQVTAEHATRQAHAREQISKLTDKDLEVLHQRNPQLFQNNNFRNALSTSQVASIEKSGFLATGRGIQRQTTPTGTFIDTPGTVTMANNATMRSRRKAAQNEREVAAVPSHVATLASGATGATRDAAVQGISGLDKDDLVRIEQSNPAMFNNPHFASAMSKAQITSLEQSADHNPATLTAVYAQRGAVLMGHIATGDANSARKLIRSMSEAEQRRTFTQINNSIAGMPAGEVRTLTQALSGPLITNLSPGSFIAGGVANPNIARELTGDQLQALHAAAHVGDTAKHALYQAIVDKTSGTARPRTGTQRTAFSWLTRTGSVGLEWEP